MDTDAERRIEESFYEERERHKKANNLPKKSMDHSLLRNKIFFNESDQKESPKFTQLIDESVHKEDSKSLSGTLKQPLSNITNMQILPRTSTNKQFEEAGRDRRFRSRYSVESNIGKPVQFSPYKRPTSRRPRHNYLSKENIPIGNLPDFQQQLNRSSITIDKLSTLELENKQLKARQQVYKKEIRILTEELAKERTANANVPVNNNESQIKELLLKIDGLQEVTHQLKESVRTLKWENKELEDKGKTFTKLESEIRRQLAMENQDMSLVLEALLKKYKKNESFVDSIADMRSKITGIKESNLKELWRWLKKTVQEIHSINQFLVALKAELKLPREAKFQQLKMKLAKRIFS